MGQFLKKNDYIYENYIYLYFVTLIMPLVINNIYKEIMWFYVIFMDMVAIASYHMY